MMFRRDENGYILVLSLIALPVFFGFALIIIDIGRGNNAHADLAAAADGVALAGAVELDGGVDAIPRAKAAMANLTNTVSMLGREGPDMEISLVYEDVAGNEFFVAFLTDIPDEDTTPIDTAYLTANSTTDSTLANFVYVRAKSKNLETAFFNPLSMLTESVPVGATAVAKSFSAACDIPPLYICNPFEFDSSGNYVGDQLQSEFSAGNLHGRMFRLHPPGSSTHAPGNFGFLSVNGSSSASAIRDMFAGKKNPTCYESDKVRTKPGAATGINQGFNVRFDIYEGPYSNWNNNTKSFEIHPPINTRKGSKPVVNSGTGEIQEECVGTSGGSADLHDDHIWDPDDGWNADGVDDNVFGLPDNTAMLAPNEGVPGAYMGSSDDWDVQRYLDENYGAGTYLESEVDPAFSGMTPSRYDVYRHEIANDWHLIRSPGDEVEGNDTGEMGASMCGPYESPPLTTTDDPDPRVMVAAILDCTTYGDGGGVNYVPVNSYGSFFMTRPWEPSINDTLDVEIIDITGFGGNGTLDTFIREEAILVR